MKLASQSVLKRLDIEKTLSVVRATNSKLQYKQ